MLADNNGRFGQVGSFEIRWGDLGKRDGEGDGGKGVILMCRYEEVYVI